MGRTEGRSVGPKVGPKVDPKVDLKVGLKEDHSVGPKVGSKVDHSVGPKVDLMEDHSVDQTEDRLADRSVDLRVAQKEGPMAVRLVVRLAVLQDLSEVQVVLRRFAQLVLVLVQARLPVLRALVVLDLEWVFV